MTAQRLLVSRLTWQEDIESEPGARTMRIIQTSLFCCRQKVEVEEAAHQDFLPHLVVKLPVPHQAGLEMVDHTRWSPGDSSGPW